MHDKSSSKDGRDSENHWKIPRSFLYEIFVKLKFWDIRDFCAQGKIFYHDSRDFGFYEKFSESGIFKITRDGDFIENNTVLSRE